MVWQSVHLFLVGENMNSAKDNLKARVLKLLDTEIDFVSNRSFNSPDFELETLIGLNFPKSAASNVSMQDKQSQNLSPHLARLCEAEVLSVDEERALFRRMNFLKYKANSLRSQLAPDFPDLEKINAIDLAMHESENIRNYIFRSNMRLVVSIIKKCVTPYITFEDLLSDGIWTLMKAVDKFDYDRGFRFSTYAYRAISNYAYRKIADRKKEMTRFTQTPHDRVLEETRDSKRSMMGEQPWEEISSVLTKTIDKLDQREQFIVQGRFALGNFRSIKTFQKLADELGISKERVRQLEQRAVAKLRSMVEDAKYDMLRELAGF